MVCHATDKIFAELGQQDLLSSTGTCRSKAAELKPRPGRGLRSMVPTILLLGGAVLTVLLLIKAFTAGASNSPAELAKPDPMYQTKNIEDIVAGDLVLAEHPETGKQELRRVVEAYRRRVDHLQIVYLRSSDGTRQIIKTTDEHPFWVDGNGWVKAEKLKRGQRVRQANGQVAIVKANVYEPHPEGIDVYNFQVEGFHTYFVAANGARGPPVLVHNTSQAPTPLTNQQALQQGLLVRNARVDASDLRGARANPGGVTGHAAGKHGFTDDMIADIINNAERSYVGVNNNGRRVNIFVRNGDAVITEGDDLTRIITSYGQSGYNTLPGGRRVPGRRVNTSGWDNSPQYHEVH